MSMQNLLVNEKDRMTIGCAWTTRPIDATLEPNVQISTCKGVKY